MGTKKRDYTGAIAGVLTQAEFYTATWDVVNSPSTSVTKWGPIEDWDTSGVTTLRYAFSADRNEAGDWSLTAGNPKAATFNGDISKWITTSATSMKRTFNGARAFNGDISKWITSSVKHMGDTFNDAAAFNGDVSAFNTSSVLSMGYTFYKAASFTGTGVDLWNINKVRDLGSIFDMQSGGDPCAGCTTALTSCNKRKIADAWKNNAVFTATTYDTDWAADKCPVLCVAGTTFSTSGNAPCTTCAADATCTTGVKTACTTTTNTVCKVSTVSLLFVFDQGLLVIASYIHSVHNYPPHTHTHSRFLRTLNTTLAPLSIYSFIHFQVSSGTVTTDKTSGGNTATTSLVGVVAATAMATAAVCLP